VVGVQRERERERERKVPLMVSALVRLWVAYLIYETREFAVLASNNRQEEYQQHGEDGATATTVA